MADDSDAGPTRLSRAAPLTRRERQVVGVAAAAPVGLAVLVLVPVAIVTGASAGDVVAASLVYGGLVGLAASFLAVDRLQARQCPRCRQRVPRRAEACEACGYDVARRPRYACDERHAVYLDAGLCACGRRLQALPTARGVGREVVFVLKVGMWLLVFLVGVALLLQALERNL